jgi:hypothetical protein
VGNFAFMDPASLAATLTGAQTSATQMAMAAKMIRMNADNAASIVKVIESAQVNMTSLANVAAGVGQNLDISV